MTKHIVRILEVGCGKGRNAYFLSKKKNVVVVGIDVVAENVFEARKTFLGVEFLQMSVEQLAFPDASFDKVYALDVLEHVDNLTLSVSEIVRVLKLKGKLIVNVPAAKSEEWLLRLRPSYHREIHHVRIFRGSELVNTLAVYGLRQQRCKATAFLDHMLLYYLFTRSKISASQLGVGDWRGSVVGRIVFALHAYTKFDLVFQSWLKFVPIWVISLPLAWVVNSVGNRFFPKSMYYKFIKE